MDNARTDKNGTLIVDNEAKVTIDLEQKGMLSTSPEAIGGFLNAVKLRRLSSKDHTEYQAWVEGLDDFRKALLSCYELGYLHGCADERLRGTLPTRAKVNRNGKVVLG